MIKKTKQVEDLEELEEPVTVSLSLDTLCTLRVMMESMQAHSECNSTPLGFRHAKTLLDDLITSVAIAKTREQTSAAGVEPKPSTELEPEPDTVDD